VDARCARSFTPLPNRVSEYLGLGASEGMRGDSGQFQWFRYGSDG